MQTMMTGRDVHVGSLMMLELWVINLEIEQQPGLLEMVPGVKLKNGLKVSFE